MDELGEFLRSRRSRTDPASLGVPVVGHRRVDGLRREEVSHLSGVSVDYYVRLEQGRATHPSPQVLDSLASVLGLDETERGHLHRLADRQLPRARPTGEVRPELQRVLDLVVSAPAILVDHRLDALAGNAMAELLYDQPVRGMNLARDLFGEGGDGGLYEDWEGCTRDVVGHLRLAAGMHPDDDVLATLIAELTAASERFRGLWAQADVTARSHGRKLFRHPTVGRLELDQESFAVPGSPGVELVVMSAAPGTPAADGLQLLAALVPS